MKTKIDFNIDYDILRKHIKKYFNRSLKYYKNGTLTLADAYKEGYKQAYKDIYGNS